MNCSLNTKLMIMDQRMDNLKSKITTIKKDIADIIIESINKNDYTITLKSLIHPNSNMLNGRLVVVDSGDDAEIVFDTGMNITTIGYVVDLALEVYKIMLTHETYECKDAIRDVLQSKIITKILAQQTELLNNLQNELIDIKKTISKNSQTDSDTDTIGQTVEEDEEEKDFTFWIPKDLDKFYSIWITDDKTSYKNPIIACDDEVDTSYMDESDIYDIAHNISIFENKNDAEQYAKHINIDMTIYRLKCYYHDHVSEYDQSDDAIYLGYVTDDNGVDFYYTYVHGKFSRFVKPISSALSPDMWKWMRPILTKYFGFNIVGEV